MEPITLGALCAALFVAAVLPGPCAVLTVGRTVRQGIVAGLVVSAGVLASDLLLCIAALAAIQGVLAISEQFFAATKWAGIAVLLVLAARMLMSACSREVSTDPRRTAALGNFCAGALLVLSSPGTFVILLVLLPQFVATPGGGPGAAALAVGATLAGTAAAQAGAMLAGVLRVSRKRARWVEYAGAALLTGFAGVALLTPLG